MIEEIHQAIKRPKKDAAVQTRDTSGGFCLFCYCE